MKGIKPPVEGGGARTSSDGVVWMAAGKAAPSPHTAWPGKGLREALVVGTAHIPVFVLAESKNPKGGNGGRIRRPGGEEGAGWAAPPMLA